MARPEGGGLEAARLAEVRALRVAQEAAAHVPAYARFLRQHGYDAARLRSFADFCALPVMDKDSYLRRYPLADRCLGGEVPRAQLVISSSGTSGAATLWPRLPEQEPRLTAATRAMLQEHFDIEHRWTLVVVAAAMGPWSFATGVTQSCQDIFSAGDVRGTVVTPGMEREEVLRFVEELSRYYDQTILVSYPALVPTLLEAGLKRDIDWAALNTGLWLGGECMTESQRERILQYLGKDPEQLAGIVNVLGASEAAGSIGYETRLCLLIRRLCTRDPALVEALFGTRILPSVNQFNPHRQFFEVQDGELLMTMEGATPLVRYNTHDRGGVIPFEVVEAICRTRGYDLRAELRARGLGPEFCRPLPFVYVLGRSNAIILHGGNVYLEEFAEVLEQDGLRSSNTGNFEVSTVTDANGEVTLHMAVELNQGVTATDPLRALYEHDVLEGLRRVSARFRAAYDASQGRARLVVQLVPYGTFQGRGPKQQRVVLAHETSAAQPPVTS